MDQPTDMLASTDTKKKPHQTIKQFTKETGLNLPTADDVHAQNTSLMIGGSYANSGSRGQIAAFDSNMYMMNNYLTGGDNLADKPKAIANSST